MKRVVIKNFSIKEGHYTGEKSIKKIPGTVKVITKSILAGLGIGTAVGAVLPKEDLESGAKEGIKTGFWGGIALKTLINKFHKPMSSIKFQEVDKAIRKEFGIREFSGMIIGDSKENSDDFNSHFSFNNPNFFDFKINVLIQKKKITFYTLDLSKKELDLLNESLDYYCYKYFGMEYSSKLLNEKRNSYSVTVIFTNYKAIASFFIEIASVLNTKINILDKENKIIEETISSEEKTFSSVIKSSLPLFDKYDILKIISTGGTVFIKSGFKKNYKDYILDSLVEGISIFSDKISAKITPWGIKVKRKSLNNFYLERCFQDLGFKEGRDYSVKKNSSQLNIYLYEGYFIMCSNLTGQKLNKLTETIINKYKFIKTDVKGSVTLYTYLVESKASLDRLIRDLINLNIKPNIYTK